ncbi:SIMPL domain-containing protein [Halalkalibacillus sediminis]|uniref:SIMPL domain-containing protein n=1 Tax=Halalkalibacillus sediminis TaxID=2018042 RepID=A0A2I0QTG1_9BACI|nr:SIMPL domain-containing protein [Halalkalibacillus sediminis]PKR77599.1 SIMPL domain-containing protein [Halalkalibacillus sediminis]
MEKSRVLTVFGTASLRVAPDIAEIQVGVVTEDTSLEQALQENSSKMNQVINSLLQLGIPEEDIRTTTFRIQPMYDYVDGQQVFRGYQVTNMVSVRISDITQVGLIVDTAVRNGANQISDLNFMLSNPNEIYRAALSEALLDATANAMTLTNTMQVNMDPIPIRVDELPQSVSPEPRMYSMAEVTSGTPIQPGEIVVEANIEAKFQYGSDY